MQKITVTELIDELETKKLGFSIDKTLFTNILLNTEIKESSEFTQTLPKEAQLIREGSSVYSYFSLRKVLINNNANYEKQSYISLAIDQFKFKRGTYSSNSLIRSIKGNSDLVEIMKSAGFEYSMIGEYSLLGKMKTYDISEDVISIETKPKLIVSGASNSEEINKWEREHIRYQKENRIFGLIPLVRGI